MPFSILEVKVLRYFRSREQKFQGTKVPWNESSRERKFHPSNFCFRERKYVGTKVRVTLLIDDDSHYLFCYTSDRNGDGINLIICVILR